MSEARQKGGKKSFAKEAFDRTFQIFAVLALVFGAATYFLSGPDAVLKSLEGDALVVARLVPVLGSAFLIAVFLQALLPPSSFSRVMGEGSGIKGMLFASGAGSVTPGGPMTSFPLVTILRDNGTGKGSLVAYVTAWTTLALQRIFVWEVPLMGAEFALLRFLASLPLSMTAGLIAHWIPIDINPKDKTDDQA